MGSALLLRGEVAGEVTGELAGVAGVRGGETEIGVRGVAIILIKLILRKKREKQR